MQLLDLKDYNPITIQCHDNPDADTIGAGFGLYCYFKEQGKDVSMIYSGRNKITKTNLRMMIDELEIPLEYIPPSSEHCVEGLLIIVDCQFGAGNVTRLGAEQIAIIDHHPQENYQTDLVRIEANLGSCATLVWRMLGEAGYPVKENIRVGTALYYGLFTDTNQFAELFNPLDMDMCEELTVNKGLMARLRNSNISLQELEIAGIALIRYNYNDDYRFAVIRANPCDPNILGLISDFLLQVAEVDTCLVYNENADGYKMSVRSCIKEVKANELAEFLVDKIGSGGGHYEKAGGFVSRRLYEKYYPTLHSEAYFNNRMTEYFDSFEIIYAANTKINTGDYRCYRRKKEAVCFLKTEDFMKSGESISIRNRNGDLDLKICQDSYITVERNGSIRIFSAEQFEKLYEISIGQQLPEDYYAQMEYVPTIKNTENGSSCPIFNHAAVAVPRDAFCVHGKKLENAVKLFAKWNDESYMLGMPGDYLTVSVDDMQDMHIESGQDFDERFEIL